MSTYQKKSACILKICIIGTNDKCTLFHDFLCEHILSSVKIVSDFNLEIDIYDSDDSSILEYSKYNFIFYMSSAEKLIGASLVPVIKQITTNFEHPRNHIFIILDESSDMGFNDDNILIYNDDINNDAFNELDDVLNNVIGDKLFHLCKISINVSKIWKIILNNGVSSLDKSQIDFLVDLLSIKKSSKLSNLKKIIKKIDIDDKLEYCGFSDFDSDVRQYFKSTYQKKIIIQNYIYHTKQLNINYSETTLDNILILLREIHDITFLNDEIHQNLISQIQQIIMDKLILIFKSYTGNNTINKKNNCTELIKYFKFLTRTKNISVTYNLNNINSVVDKELSTINNSMINYFQSEIEKNIDLDKIITLLECFENNIDSVAILFDKIKSNSKIIIENIENTEKWLRIINKSLELGINQISIIQLIENIIISKITFYGDPVNSKNINGLYPQCLQIFLMTNLDKDFIFKKLYMYLTYSIRYSGKNILEHIKNVDQYIYQNMLKIENRLLELYLVPKHNNARIIETFNDQEDINNMRPKIDTKKYRSHG